MNTCYNAVDRHVERGRASSGAHLRQPGHRRRQDIHLRELRDRSRDSPDRSRRSGWKKATASSSTCRACPKRSSRCSRAPAWRNPLGRLRRLCIERTGDADRRRQAQDDPLGIVRHRGRARHSVQAASRSGDRDGAAQAGALRGAAAAAKPGDVGSRARYRLGGTRCTRAAGRLRAARGDRSAVHPLHLGHHRHSQRRGSRQRRACGGAEMEHDERLQHRPRRGVLGGSDIGWTVGHGYIVYGPLLHGATTILYEGKPVGTPDAGAFWRVCEQHGVNVLFHGADRVSGDQARRPGGALHAAHDLSRFRLLFLAGERCDPDTLIWAGERLGVPVIDHWWQTELGWPAIANCAGLRHPADQTRLADAARSRLRHSRADRKRRGGRARIKSAKS